MNPKIIEVTRGPLVESRHQVHVAIASNQGMEVWGDVDRMTFPRSAAKLMQALPMVESGAAKRAGLTDVQLALSCASHGGEVPHATAVGAWLSGLGLSDADLECGAHWPMFDEAGRELSGQAQTPCPLHNNCSGKHAGFLTYARDQGWETAGYIEHDHPVQASIAASMSDVLETPLGPHGIDGCGIPTYANRLGDLAMGLYRLARATGVRGQAVELLAQAHRSQPFMIGGTRRACTAINGALTDGMVKYGAEGVYFGIFPKLQVGVAIKAEDGSIRSCEVAMVDTLRQIGALPSDALPDWHTQVLKNWAGVKVGEVRPQV